jgi:hypothetical protein
MYGPPAVGNGLGGLPRRASVTVSTAKQYPLKLQAVGNAITYTAAAPINTLGQAVPTGAGTGAVLFNASTTAPYGAPKGFAYDKNAGMLSWATNGTQGTAGNSLISSQAFAGGMIYFNSNATVGPIYIATTNGATTTVSTLVTIPSSGTLVGGDSYSGLTAVVAMGASSTYYPRCFDAYGNLVILYRATISAASWLCAFVINAGGTVINSQKLFVLNSSGASYTTSDFWIVRSGTGFIVGASYRATTSYMNIWNVTADFVTATAIGPSSSYTMTSGGTPGTSTFNASSTTVSISTYDPSDYKGKIWGATLDSNGAAVSHAATPTPVDIQAYSALHEYNIPEYFDPANNFYYGTTPAISFPTSSDNPGYFGTAVVWSPSSAISNSSMGVVNTQLVTAATTDIELNGVVFSNLGYLGDGYWALVWSVATVNQLKAKLYKEV